MAPLHLRHPVPSVDGEYFAYFVLAERGSRAQQGSYDLIIARRQGSLVVSIPTTPGIVLWSNAGHLVIVNETRSEAKLVANAMGRFPVLADLALSPGAEPQWSRDGNKLALRRTGPAGDELAIYDVQQAQSLRVPLPPSFRLRQTRLLFWSPGSEYLFFLNEEGDETVLDRLEVSSGEVRRLARGFPRERLLGSDIPRISADGTKIHLPRPLNSVIDAEAGETLWALPGDARVLYSPWSADGRQLFYWREAEPSQIYAYDFSSQSNGVVLSGVQPNGFFTRDGQSYFYRSLPGPAVYGAGSTLREWLQELWGWQHVDMVTQSSQPLRRVELWPWQQTLDGSILAREDHYTRVRYGLYDPNGRFLSEYVFPTHQEEVDGNLRSQRLALFAVAFYVLLGFAVFLIRSRSAPARAFYILTLLAAGILAARTTLNLVTPLVPRFPYRVALGEITGLGWWTPCSLARLLAETLGPGLIYLWALVPPAALYLFTVFPERNKFLASRRALWPPLFGAALVPLIAVLMVRQPPEAVQLVGFRLLWIAGSVVLATALAALVLNLRWPPDRRARDQVRWVTAALALALVGGLFLFVVHSVSERLSEGAWQRPLTLLETVTSVFVGLLAPLTIGYALVAYKPFDIRLLVRRCTRYSFVVGSAGVLYLLLVAGITWAAGGSFTRPPTAAWVVPVVVTSVLFALAWKPLGDFIDRTFDRVGYGFRERLEDLGRRLPQILDRQSLVATLGERIQIEMGSTRFHLFLLDRRTNKLRPQPGKGGLPSVPKEVEFHPQEPLCRYLLQVERPFEVEVSPYNPKLIPILRSAADRLGRLRGALILGLKRRHELLGLIVLGPKASDEFYNSEELDLLMRVTNQAALAFENIELFEDIARDRELRKELEDASEMQAQLLPSVVPLLSTGQVTGRCLPSRAVRGDYYDLLSLPMRKVGLAIGDVSGKGMSASLLMANLQGLVRSQAPTAESLEELMRRINRQIYHSSLGAKYCAFFFGVYDDTKRGLEFVNAGHNPPLLLTSQGTRFLESTGVPLGLFPEAAHESRHESLEPGSILILYSDGVSEARNGRGELYGLGRLTDVVKRFRESGVDRIADRLLADVSDFMAGAPVEDDQTLVLLKVNPA